LAGLIPVGLAALLGFVVGLIVISYGIKRFGKSVDGLWSVTHIQTILWTCVILGSYFALALSAGSFLSGIPTNTLVLVGIASGTLAFTNITNGVQNRADKTAKKVAALAAAGTPAKSPFMGGFLAAEKPPDFGPSMVKMQMFAWNLVTILLFVTFVGSNLYNGNYALPDIGATVSTIIGISNGAHVAAKTVDN
jgi:hypothetical protein